MFCCALLFVHSSLAIMLCLSSGCLLIVGWLFPTMPWVYLQFVIVVLPDHAHLLFSNDKDAGQFLHPRILIRAFVIRS